VKERTNYIMNIAVLGSGNGGCAVAFDCAAHGHQVSLLILNNFQRVSRLSKITEVSIARVSLKDFRWWPMRGMRLKSVGWG